MNMKKLLLSILTFLFLLSASAANIFYVTQMVATLIVVSLGQMHLKTSKKQSTLLRQLQLLQISYGIYNNDSSSPTITNCIIWGNSGTEIYNKPSAEYTKPSIPTVSYCVVEGGYSSDTNIITTDPKLGELGNYGGVVQTIPVLSGSSSIGAGTTGENIPTVDARGIERTNPPTIGAYEYMDKSPYEIWASESGLTGDRAKPEAKPFNDGITNLEKFAFGLDGSRAASYSESKLLKQSSDGSIATFEFPVNQTATDVKVKALISTDLKTWKEATATKSGEDGNFNLYKVEQEIPEGGKLFFKLEVAQ